MSSQDILQNCLFCFTWSLSSLERRVCVWQFCFWVKFYTTWNPSHSQKCLYRNRLWFCSSGTLEPLFSAHWLFLSLGEFTSSFSGSSSDSTHYNMSTLHCSGAWALCPSCSDWQACLPHWPRQCVSHILFKCLVCVIHRSCFCAMAIMLLV